MRKRQYPVTPATFPSSISTHRPSRPAEAALKPGFNDAESPLSWLRSRRDKSGKQLIGDAQYLAGEKLRSDYERSMLAGRVTANWDPSATAGRPSRNGMAEMSDGALAARQRYHKALEAIGPELAGIVVQVCCLTAGIEQAERILELPKRSGKAVLGLALTALGRHYGLDLSLDQSRRRPGTVAWSLPDYRPAIPELEEV